MITVRTDATGLTKKLEASMKRFPRAAAAGLNKAAQKGVTFSVRAIQSDIGTSSQKTIRRNIKWEPATADNPVAKIIAFSSKKDRIPLFEMGPSPKTITKRRPAIGVTIRGGSKGSRTIPGSFIADVGSGKHRGVFKRVGRERTPIRELYGPSVALVFSHRAFQSKLMAFLKTTIKEEVERVMRYVTG